MVDVVPLAYAKENLVITSDGDDAKLQRTINAAISGLERQVGPIGPKDFTATVRPPHLRRRYGSSGFNGLQLELTPILSIASVTPAGGTALDLTQLYIDNYAGLISYAMCDPYDSVARWFPATSYTVVGQAGWAAGTDDDPFPPDLVEAAEELIRHLWAPKRGSAVNRPGSRAADTVNARLPGAAYTYPIRVMELIGPFMLPAVG